MSDVLCCISESLLNHDLDFPDNPSTSLALLLNCSERVCASAGEKNRNMDHDMEKKVLAVWKVSFKSHWLAAVNEAALSSSNLQEQNRVQGPGIFWCC